MCALVTGVQTCALPICADQCRGRRRSAGKSGGPRRAGPPTVGTSRRGDAPLGAWLYPRIAGGAHGCRSGGVGEGRDRESGVSGKSVAGRVDVGGRRDIKKKKTQGQNNKRTNTHNK